MIPHLGDVVDVGDVMVCQCGGYIGVPPVGAMLVDLLYLGTETKLTGARDRLALFRCDRCKRHYVFRTP